MYGQLTRQLKCVSCWLFVHLQMQFFKGLPCSIPLVHTNVPLLFFKAAAIASTDGSRQQSREGFFKRFLFFPCRRDRTVSEAF